jgi:hypothetical protein
MSKEKKRLTVGFLILVFTPANRCSGPTWNCCIVLLFWILFFLLIVGYKSGSWKGQ